MERETKIQSQIQQHTYSIHINVFSNGQLVSQSFNAETSDRADDTIGLQSEHDKLCLELLHDARLIYTDYISHSPLISSDRHMSAWSNDIHNTICSYLTNA